MSNISTYPPVKKQVFAENPFRGKDGRHHFLYQLTCTRCRKMYFGMHSCRQELSNCKYSGSSWEMDGCLSAHNEDVIMTAQQFYESREALSRAEEAVVSVGLLRLRSFDGWKVANKILGGASPPMFGTPAYREKEREWERNTEKTMDNLYDFLLQCGCSKAELPTDEEGLVNFAFRYFTDALVLAAHLQNARKPPNSN